MCNYRHPSPPARVKWVWDLRLLYHFAGIRDPALPALPGLNSTRSFFIRRQRKRSKWMKTDGPKDYDCSWSLNGTHCLVSPHWLVGKMEVGKTVELCLNSPAMFAPSLSWHIHHRVLWYERTTVGTLLKKAPRVLPHACVCINVFRHIGPGLGRTRRLSASTRGKFASRSLLAADIQPCLLLRLTEMGSDWT